MAITITIHLNNLETKISAMIQKVNVFTMIYYKLILVALQNKALDLHLELAVGWASTLGRMGRAVPCFALQLQSLSCHPMRQQYLIVNFSKHHLLSYFPCLQQWAHPAALSSAALLSKEFKGFEINSASPLQERTARFDC